MPDNVIHGLTMLTRALEIVGAGFLLLGFVVTTERWVRQSLKQGATSALDPYRQGLGRTVLFGLEILVAATIIKTMTVSPTVEGLGYLAIMVAIRTFLGWTTTLEISGRWPWQRPEPAPARSQATSGD